MVRSSDLLKIGKITIFSLILLLAIAAISFFIFARNIFLAVTAAGFLAFITFIVTLFFYYWLNRRRSSAILKYILPAFFIKIIFVGAVFYLMFKLNFMNLIVLGLAFIIFFTIFLNIEVIIIYKKLLFRQ